MKDGQGTFTVEARRYLFGELMATQELVNRLRQYEGLPPMTLIDDEEIALIKRYWAEDEKSAPHVVTNVVGHSIDALPDLVDGKISDKLVADYIERRKSKKTEETENDAN